MFKYLYAALTYFVISSAFADEVPYAGVWQGYIGKSKVQVCFSSENSQYYYLKHLRGIVLVENKKSPPFTEWGEFKETGTWKLGETTGSSLIGSWNDYAGTRQLEIKLSKVAELAKPGKDDYYPCGKEYYRPIENSVRRSYTQAKFKDIIYREIKTDSGDAFELPNLFAGASEFNNFVWYWIKQQSVNAYSCQLNGGGGWHKELRPLVWSEKYLVVEDSLPDIYCGGAHNDWQTDFYTFDIQRGKKIDTWSWLKNREQSVKRVHEGKQTGLRSLIEKVSPRKECGGLEYVTVGPPHPTKEGLVFPFSVLPCETDALISYKALTPYLTSSGLSMAAEFSKE